MDKDEVQVTGRDNAIAVGVLLLVALALFLYFRGEDEPKEDGPDYGSSLNAWVYMQSFVEKKLKSPKTADFEFGGSRHVKDLGNGRYRVDSYVDSHNSFGALLRTRFEGVIKRIEGGWRLESLRFK